MDNQYDGSGEVTDKSQAFTSFYAGSKHSAQARATGQGGLMKKGYYWKHGAAVVGSHLPSHGPFRSRNVAMNDARRTIATALIAELA